MESQWVVYVYGIDYVVGNDLRFGERFECEKV